MVKTLAKYNGQYKKTDAACALLVLTEVSLSEHPHADVEDCGWGIPLATRITSSKSLFTYPAGDHGHHLWVTNKKYLLLRPGFWANLRNALFEKVQSFSFANLTNSAPDPWDTPTNGRVTTSKIPYMGIRILLRSPMMLIVAMFLAYRISPRLSIVMALAINILAISISLIITKARKKCSASCKTRMDALNSTIQENLIGIRG